MPRLVRALALCILMLAVAAFVMWLGVRIIVDPVGSAPHWLGWMILGVGLIKGALWLFVAGGMIRHRHAVMLSR